MHVFALLDRTTAFLGSVKQLVRQTYTHGLAAAQTRRFHDPTHRERQLPLRAYLDGDLIGRAADATALDLYHRPYVVDRLIEDAECVGLTAARDRVECPV